MPKINQPLTDTRIRNEKPSEKEKTLFDSHVTGLYLIVHPTGKKAFH